MTRHKHADLMIAYANDTSLVVEVCEGGDWCETSQPLWRTDLRYRIKPATKKAYVFMYQLNTGKWIISPSINATVAEDNRSSCIRDGYVTTEIKEVEFE